jgi:small-conductance mechanosensitive channel
VAVLSVEPDVLRLIPTGYAVVGRLGTLVLASILGTVVVRAVLGVLFSGERAESMSGLRTVSAWAAYVLLGLFIISGVGINLSGFLLGSAVIGVVVGTAAQSSLSNLFAGAMLVAARPYRVGDWAYFRNALFGGAEYEGVVTSVGALYTTLASDGQPLRIPNSVAMSAVVRTDDRRARASIETRLREGTSIRGLQRSIRDRLELGQGDRVLVRPALLDNVDGGALGCRVEVQSRRHIDTDALLNALREVDREARAAAAP